MTKMFKGTAAVCCCLALSFSSLAMAEGEESQTKTGGNAFSTTIPENMGLAIWGATDAILTGLREVGFRWVVDNLMWSDCEKEKGKYDFSSYEQAINLYKKHGFRLSLALSGGNEIYEPPDTSASRFGEEMKAWVLPKSEEGRKAWVQWTVETIRHFQGQGIVWVLVGEPESIPLTPAEYCRLNEEVARELPEGEILSGPGTAADISGLPTTVTNPKYSEGVLAAGCHKYWNVLQFQTYLWDTAEPEEVEKPIEWIRERYAKNSPDGKDRPIFTTLGYPSNVEEGWMNSSEEKQAKMLARIFLTDQLSRVNVTLWYNHQDDIYATSTWNSYGLYRKPNETSSVLEPKPAYFAAKAFSSILKGFRFTRRFEAGGPENYVLEFTNGTETRYAAWTRSGTPITVTAPFKRDSYQIFSHLGDKSSELKMEQGASALKLTDAPVYFIPVNSLAEVASET